MRGPLVLLLVVLALGPLVPAAHGQVGNPSDFSNNPHPGMPWSPGTYGAFVRHIPVAPRSVVLNVAVPGSPGLPPELRQQVVQIPGFTITETTIGFYYPERWTIDQLNVGVYQWRKLPAEFRRK